LESTDEKTLIEIVTKIIAFEQDMTFLYNVFTVSIPNSRMEALSVANAPFVRILVQEFNQVMTFGKPVNFTDEKLAAFRLGSKVNIFPKRSWLGNS